MTTTAPVKTALCSFGMSGKVFHAPFVEKLSTFELYGVWERTKDEAKKIYPHVVVFRTLEDMLADEQVELVIVNTPNATHFDYASRALLAGKHVVVEKPFTVTTAEAKELIQTAREKKRILTVYQNRRYDSDFLTVQKLVTENTLGKLTEVQIEYDRFRIGLSPKQHKELPVPGAGILYDLGAHIIDQALRLFGVPEAIFADIRHLRPQTRVDDAFEILFYYGSFRVRLKASHLVKEGSDGYQLHGLMGSFRKPKTDVQENDLKRGVVPGTEGWGTEPESEWGILRTTDGAGREIKRFVPSEQGDYTRFYTNLHAAIRENVPLDVTPQSAARVVYMIEVAFESSRQQKVLPVQLENWM